MTDQATEQQPQPAAQPTPEATPQQRSYAQIAREVYGKEFHGEVAEAKPVEKIEETKPVDAQAGEEPPPDVKEQADGEEPAAGETTETAPAEDAGEMPIATVSELVEHLEANPEWFDGLKMSFTVDGMPTEATIKDLVDSYQIRGAAEHRLEKAKAFAQEKADAWMAKNAEIDNIYQTAGALLQRQRANLERDVKAIDPRLREEDPAEWAARVQEFQQRHAQINEEERNAYSQIETLKQTRARESAELRDQVKAEQAQLLLQNLPEWQDTTKAETEKRKIADYALRSGYMPQELDNLLDHRYVMTLRKAMLYDETRGQVDAAKKRVAKVPKVMKPGAPKAREQLASERLAALKAKLDKTGLPEDALAYTLAKRGAR